MAAAEEFDANQLRLFWDTHILPKWGSVKLTKVRTIELQGFFNSFSPRLNPKTRLSSRAGLRLYRARGYLHPSNDEIQQLCNS